MQEWFKAWRDDNYTVRDYRPYFRPNNLCYLEGAWTTDTDAIDEPFDSIRHQLDADSWQDMFEKIRFMSHTGDKNLLENLAFLPSAVVNVTDGVPTFGQWNYRILCHPIEGDIKLSDLELVDDLGKRLSGGKMFEKYSQSRTARFALSPSNIVDLTSTLDEIMALIPGKDNYGVNIVDNTLTRTKLRPSDDTPLNVGNYHRWFKLTEKGAMGENTIHRAFNDRNLFVAETTQSKVVPGSVKLCKYPLKRKQNAECEIVVKRVSYAIPLEIVFRTPLQSWNPYNIQHKGDYKSELGLTVAAGDRNGGKTQLEAYDGINDRYFYMTPIEFFTLSGGGTDADSADTTRNSVGVLDPRGNVRKVTASGIRMVLPEIPEVGTLQIRYPIMPQHMEGSSIWKELEALRDVVMDMNYFYTSPSFSSFYTDCSSSSSSAVDPNAEVVLVT